MAITTVLAVGLDSWQLAVQSSELRSAGFVFTSVMSSREAIEHFQAGDFDLVLLGHSIPMDQKERLTFLIRASAPSIPVVCIAKSPRRRCPFADATVKSDVKHLLKGMKSVLVKAAKSWAAQRRLPPRSLRSALV